MLRRYAVFCRSLSKLQRVWSSPAAPVCDSYAGIFSLGSHFKHFTGVSGIVCRRYAHSENVTKADRTESGDDPEDPEYSAVAKAVPHDVLVSKLQDCSTVEDQMMRLCSELRLTPEDIQQRLSLCDIISDMLQPFFNDYKVQLFGSSVNSFGFKGCDIDMAFNVGTKFDSFMPVATDDSHIPTIADVLEGRTSPSYMSRLACKDQLLFIHSVFLDYYKESTTAPMFISAYMPIIRFVHDRYQLKCDLSCGNWSALINTKVLYAYNAFDERVAPLVMAIRYWGKHVGLIGGGLMFNTYCITLLVIYFLQTRTPPVLPSVEYLVSHLESLKSFEVFDENVLKEVKMLPRSENTQTVEELLREFFFFYLYFDFSRVICPKTATSVPRDSFGETMKNKRFRYSTICVQDPFKSSHNVANLVDYRNCKKFAKEMLYASNLFQGSSVWTQKSEPWGLISLFNKPADLTSAVSGMSTWTVDIPLPQTCADSKSSKLVERSELQNLARLVLDVLEKGLLLKCKSVDIFSEAPEHEKQLLLRALCFCEHNTWLGRKTIELEESPSSSGDVLEHEHLLSQKLSQRKSDEKKNHFQFSCKIYASDYGGWPSLSLVLTSSSESGFNPVLGIFLKEYLPKTMRKLL